MVTTLRPYKNQELKNLKSQDVFVRPKNMVIAKELDQDRINRLKDWITFFRRNQHIFIEDYMGVKLYPYQKLIIYAMQQSDLSYIIAARASAKSWLASVFAISQCILYPGSEVVIVAKTLRQAGLIVSKKISTLMDESPNIRREILKFTSTINSYIVEFRCGSTITVVASSENSRGNRSTLLIFEEARLIPQDVIEKVLLPFSVMRMPPYRKLPEYANDERLDEHGKISYISSAWYTSEPWFKGATKCIERVVAGDETASFLAFDYLICVKHNIKSWKMILNETANMSKMTISMEYCNIPSGASGKAYFKSSLFKRKLKQAFYPQKNDTYDKKKNPYGIKKVDGEIRIVTVDVATRANKTNDNSINACIRLIPVVGKGFERHLSYMESHPGQHVGVQADRIKELYFDFEADYLVIDLQAAGIGIFDSLSENTLSEERGLTYPPLTVVDEIFTSIKPEAIRDLRENHTRGINALPVIFPITASASLNHKIATSFRSSLQKGLWKFLFNEGEAERFLLKTAKEFRDNDDNSENHGFFLNPYVQTSLFISECINLDMKLVNGLVKLEEKSGAFKDRYSAISYADWIISSEFDRSLLTEENESDDYDIMAALVQSVN